MQDQLSEQSWATNYDDNLQSVCVCVVDGQILLSKFDKYGLHLKIIM